MVYYRKQERLQEKNAFITGRERTIRNNEKNIDKEIVVEKASNARYITRQSPSSK